MAKNKEIASGFWFKLGEKFTEKLGDFAGGLMDDVGGNLSEKAKRALMEKPRATLDYALDHLYKSPILQHYGKPATKKAGEKVRDRLDLAMDGKAKYTEDELANALLKYETLGSERYAKRLFEVGMMNDRDFWRRIDTLVNEGVKQKITIRKKKIASSISEGKKKSVKFIKDQKDKVSIKIEENNEGLETENLEDHMPGWMKRRLQKANEFKNR